MNKCSGNCLRVSIIRLNFIRPVLLTLIFSFASTHGVWGLDHELANDTRHFTVQVNCAVHSESPQSPARIWLPLPPTNPAQTVEILELNFPGPVRFTRENEYGNRMFYVETTTDSKGAIEFSARFDVRRNEIQASRPVPGQLELEKARRQRLLQPDRLVPLTGRPEELLTDWELEKQTLDRARQLYEIVDQHMAYDKSKPGYGNGDVLWACESGTGNCTDFHSLFISLARNQGIPAVFEIGLPLPEQRGSGTISGYHCWAQFYVEGHGWIPVDISEADKQPALKDYYFGNLTEDRVTFSYGRDLRLEPPQAGPPLNYFVLPYVEVDGQTVDKEQLDWKLEYQDVSAIRTSTTSCGETKRPALDRHD